MIKRAKTKTHLLRICTTYFPHIWALNGIIKPPHIVQITWYRKEIVTLVAIVLLFGTTSNTAFIKLAEALLSVQNFANAQQIVEPGVTIYKYETESANILTDKIEFDTGTITSDQFEVGSNDIATVSDIDDHFILNHYGANQPNILDHGDWWDDDADPSTKYNWRYRQCFDIDYSSGATNLIEYQLYLDFDTATEIAAGTMQSNGEDIRIVDPNSNIIDHYIADDIDTASTRIWIQPDTITAGTTTNYCLYYGNPAAASTSDKNAVFTYSNLEDLYYVLAENTDNDTINFGSYVDNNNIIVDSYNQSYSQYEINTISGGGASATSNTEILANGPIQATLAGAGVDSVVPISSAGTEFSYRMDRGTHILEFVSPFCNANIEIYNTTNLGTTVPGGSFTINMGDAYTWDESIEGTAAFSNDDAVYITSTNGCPVLSHHRTTTNTDTFPMFPASNEDWYGVGSNRLEVSTYTTSTISIYDSGATSPTNVTLDATNGYHVDDAGAGSQGDPPSQRVTVNSGGPVGAKSIADGDGNESSTLYPRSEMDTKYIIPEAAEYVTMATIAGANTTVEIYNDASNCIFGGSPDQTGSANSTNDFPGHIRFGPVPQGACMVSNHPIAPYYEKDGFNDETNLWSWKQGRQRVQVEPGVSIGSVESGTWSLGTSDSWNSRLPVTITNNVSNALSEYPIRIPLAGEIDILTNAQTDGGDVRIAGSIGSGTDNQDYYLEEFNNSFAGNGDIWTQANVAGNGNQTLYIYYNSTTTQVSNANQESVFTYVNAKPLYFPVNSNSGGTFNIYSFIDDNTLFFLGADYSDWDQGENYTDPGVISSAEGIVTQGEIFQATGPINAGFTSDATDSIHPISWAGTKFLTADTRYEQEFSILAPFANSNVTFEESTGTGWQPLGATVNLTQGVPQNVIRNTQNGTGTTPANGIRITSTSPIIVHTHGNNGGQALNDSLLLYPADETFEESTNTYELYGVSSNQLLLTTENPTTQITLYYEDGTSNGPFNITSLDSNIYSEGGQAQGAGIGMKIVADGPIGAQSQADSDGTEEVVFLPKKEFADEFLMITGTQYISIVSDDEGTVCTVYDELGVQADTITLSSNPDPFVNQGTLGNTTPGGASQFQAGYYMNCTNPVYAYYEKNGDDSNGNITDETTLLSFPQARKKAEVEPIITDIDDVQVVEEGLYYESGYDSDTTATDPEATISFIFDANGFNNPAHISWNSLDWGSVIPIESQANNVDPIEVRILSGDGLNCSSTTYTPISTITNPLDFIPIAASDNRCLQLIFTIRTGDEAFSPQINDITLNYSDPVRMDDITNINTINIDGNISATNKNQRVLKFTISNPNLDNQLHELSYQSGSSTADFSTWELDLVELDSTTTINQFSYPTFPTTPPAIYSGNTANIDTTTSNALYLNHARVAGLTSQFEIESHIYLEGVNSTEINRPYIISVSGN